MARQSENKLYNSILRGLITEATEIAFPENASVAEENFVAKKNGIRERRPGIDYEASHATTSIYSATTAFNSYEWNGAGGDPSARFVVQQNGPWLEFYTRDSSLSDGKHSTYIQLDSYKIGTASISDVAGDVVSLVDGNGLLYVVGQYIEPLQITYTGSTFTVNILTIQDRDFEGVDDGYDPDFEPTVLTDEHLYNLTNQGWANRTTDLSAYYAGVGKYPSNSHQWKAGKYVNTGSGRDTWDYQNMQYQEFGNSAAPRGHYILDTFNQNNTVTLSFVGTITATTYPGGAGAHIWRLSIGAHSAIIGDTVTIAGHTFNLDTGGGCPGSALSLDGARTVTGIGSTWIEVTVNLGESGAAPICSGGTTGTASYDRSYTKTNAYASRPTVVGFFAGRVWYAGAKGANVRSKIYYSQLIKDPLQAAKCYQAADPTAEIQSDLVDTDGGFVLIPEMGQPYAMFQFDKGLLVFADNGVWEIGGGDTGYFTATSYSVRKVTGADIVASRSIVDVEGMPYYWSRQGIYRIVKDDVTAQARAENLTQDTIQSFYNDININNKYYAVGCYNSLSKEIYWGYSLTTNDGFRIRRLLILDLKFKGFYPQVIEDGTPYPVDMCTTYITDPLLERLKVKFTTIVGGTYTYSDLSDYNFTDWYSYDSVGIDAAGYILTGYEVMGEPTRKKDALYCHVFLERTEENWVTGSGGGLEVDKPSSCTMQARWDWADSSASGKFSSSQEVYRHPRVYVPVSAGAYDDGRPVVVTKNKVRGQGRALHLKFSTSPGKYLNLIGWNLNIQSNVTQ